MPSPDFNCQASFALLPDCSRLRGVGFHFSSFLWFCEFGGQVWAALFTVVQPPTQFLSSLLGPSDILCQAGTFNPPVVLSSRCTN